MKRFLIAAASLTLLTACQTTDQRIALDDRTCQSYGVAPGSPAYVQCRTNLDREHADVQAAQGFGRSGGLVGAIERSAN